MLATSDEFGIAVESNDVTYNYNLDMDIDGAPDVNLSVVSLELNESLTTSVPTEVSLRTGYPARQLTVVLAGVYEYGTGIHSYPNDLIANPNFETDTSGWAPGSSFTAEATKIDGKTCALITANVDVPNNGTTLLSSSAQVSDKQLIHFTGQIVRLNASGPPYMRILMLCYDVNSAYLGAVSVTSAANISPPMPVGEWIDVGTPAVQPLAGTTQIRYAWYPSVPTYPWSAGGQIAVTDAHMYTGGDVVSAPRDATWLFNPYNADSPLFRKKVVGSSVTLDLGVKVPPRQVSQTSNPFPDTLHNLIKNPSFVRNVNTWSSDVGFTLTQGTPASNHVGYRDNYSMVVTANTAVTAGTNVLAISDVVDLPAGATILNIASMIRNQAGSTAFTSVTLYASFPGFGDVTFSDGTINASGITSWFDVSGTVAIPAGATQVQLKWVTTNAVPFGNYLLIDNCAIIPGLVQAQGQFMGTRFYFDGDVAPSVFWGDYQEVSWDGEPYNSSSTATMSGFLPTVQMVRKFAGQIDSLEIDYQTGEVTITCIDNRSQLHTLPQLPTINTSEELINFIAGITADLTTSEYVMDYILRRATNSAISSWPPVRAHAVVAAGLRTSRIPEVGVQADIAGIGTYGPGAAGSALYNGATAYYNISSSGDFYIECLILNPNANGFGVDSPLTEQGSYSVLFILSQSILVEYCTNLSDGLQFVSIPNIVFATDTPYRLGIYFHLVTTTFTVTAVNLLDTKDTQTSTFSQPSPHGNDAGYSVNRLVARDCAGIQFDHTSFTMDDPTWTPKAWLDQSLNPILAVPAVSGDPWDIIQSLADAELGMAGFDEDGVFRTYNRETLRKRASSRDVSGSASLTGLTSVQQASAFIPVVQCEVSGYAQQPAALLMKAENVLSIPPKTTKTFIFTLPDSTEGLISEICTKTGSAQYGDTNDAPWSDGDIYFRTSSASNGKGSVKYSNSGDMILPSNVDFQILSSRSISITMTNVAPVTAYLVSDQTYTDLAPGTPFLYIGGVLLQAAATTVVTSSWPPDADLTASTTLQLSQNQWRQNNDAVQDMTDFLIEELYAGKPLPRNIALVPDPRLQLADKIHLTSERADLYVTIQSIDTTYEGGNLNQALDAQAVGTPGSWLMGIAGRSEMGEATYV